MLPQQLRRSLTWDQGAEMAQLPSYGSTPACRSTSVTRRAHGSAAPTRTPTGCCAERRVPSHGQFPIQSEGPGAAHVVRAGRANLRRTGELLDRLLVGWPDTRELRAEMLECEHVGDRLTHDLIHQLYTTPPRPLGMT